MIPVTQTKRGGPDVPPEERGDCFDACLASILEVAIDEVSCPHVDDWWGEAQRAVGRHGYRLLYVSSEPTKAVEFAAWAGDIYWLAGVPSLNLGLSAAGEQIMHVVVMRGAELVHDPSLGQRYPLGPVADDFMVQDSIVLAPFEIRSQVAA